MNINEVMEQMDTCAKRLILHLDSEPKTLKKISQSIARDTGKLYPERVLNHWVNFFCVDGYVSRIERGKTAAPVIVLGNGRGHKLQSKIRAAGGGALKESTSPPPPEGRPTIMQTVRMLIADIRSK